eukprot:scaffold135_cov249-Pinguiococcus_pyrenoidosus.AAC.21
MQRQGLHCVVPPRWRLQRPRTRSKRKPHAQLLPAVLRLHRSELPGDAAQLFGERGQHRPRSAKERDRVCVHAEEPKEGIALRTQILHAQEQQQRLP